MQTPMMSCHLIPIWHEWNTIADDIMMTWFTLYVNPSDITSGMCNTYMVHVLYVELACEWPGMHTSQPKLSENNHFTFLGTKYTKCKPEHAKLDSHCISQ